jgi:hypothetical protein
LASLTIWVGGVRSPECVGIERFPASDTQVHGGRCLAVAGANLLRCRYRAYRADPETFFGVDLSQCSLTISCARGASRRFSGSPLHTLPVPCSWRNSWAGRVRAAKVWYPHSFRRCRS